jgi:hypothetical protein
MKIDILDAHSRLEHIKSRDSKQNLDIGECCQNLIDQKPFGDYPFYIFAHTRTDDDGVTKRLIWQPRLTKPKMEPNSMLFKAYPGRDQLKVFWMLPAKEMWKQYEKGKLTENKTVSESIYDYKNNRDKLEAKEEDDLSDAVIDQIYKEISAEAQRVKLKTSVVSQVSSKVWTPY